MAAPSCRRDQLTTATVGVSTPRAVVSWLSKRWVRPSSRGVASTSSASARKSRRRTGVDSGGRPSQRVSVGLAASTRPSASMVANPTGALARWVATGSGPVRSRTFHSVAPSVASDSRVASTS